MTAYVAKVIRVTLCGISKGTTSTSQSQHGGVNLRIAVVAPQLAHSDFMLFQHIRCGLPTAAPCRDLIHSFLANLTSALLSTRHPYWKALIPDQEGSHASKGVVMAHTPYSCCACQLSHLSDCLAFSGEPRGQALLSAPFPNGKRRGETIAPAFHFFGSEVFEAGGLAKEYFARTKYI